jgi:pyridoxamine 5'-phosphate oxidase
VSGGGDGSRGGGVGQPPVPEAAGPFEGARLEYRAGALADDEATTPPLERLRGWLDDAIAAGLAEPTAVTLATVDASGSPDARIVLLRGLDERGVSWFTNHRSAKGRQLAAAPVAAVVAYWQPLERQVRLRGPVEPLADAESDAYFASRPRESQLGAWASDQSEPIVDRAAFDRQVADVAARFAGGEVPRPPHWGGFLLRPEAIEFWQGRPARLHDRLRYVRTADGAWEATRLQP